MNDTLTAAILHTVERAPQWVRHDLDAKDPALRSRAEETLAAMISSAVRAVEGAAGTDDKGQSGNQV
ncbi:DUF6771 family protein [Novosphingobium sp. ZW T3_23]|uniref:DUF6771 family protein n=1 Tax=Novosphingobium sp. ZW T3_23 TaxID=3378084 RepID=UPI0038531B90